MKRLSRSYGLALVSYSFLLASCSWLTPTLAHAQGVPVSGGGLNLSVSTANPAPGQSETVTAKSYNIDINGAMVTWTVNGKETQKGIGLTTLKLNAPALGKKISISVNAVSADGTRVFGSIAIQSGSVDMILETDGYTPPFFMGKLPIAYQNTVKITAIPHLADASGIEFDPKTLVYQWKRNGQVISDQSGYGKQSITLLGDSVPRAYTITVDVSTRNGTSGTSGYMPVSFSSPSILFYVNDPLYGPLYNLAVGNSLLIGSQRETSVLGVPFGFNRPAGGLGNLSLNWLINSVSHPELDSSDSVILRAPDNAGGNSVVELDIQNSQKILQGSKSAFSVIFNNSQTASSSPTNTI